MMGNGTDPNLEHHDPEQVRLMSEMCIVIDENDKRIGADTKKNCHLMSNINSGLLHRAFSVFLFDSSNRLLLQQRSDEKITFPGYWTNTCCSHPLNVEDEKDENNYLGVKRAARRKLYHELGIEPNHIDLNSLQYLTRIHYLSPSDDTWGEHEIDYILIIKQNVDHEPNLNEVKDTAYMTKSELKTFINDADKNGIKLTPWFKLITEHFLYTWWDHLDSLHDLKELNTIHRMIPSPSSIPSSKKA